MNKIFSIIIDEVMKIEDVKERDEIILKSLYLSSTSQYVQRELRKRKYKLSVPIEKNSYLFGDTGFFYLQDKDKISFDILLKIIEKGQNAFYLKNTDDEKEKEMINELTEYFVKEAELEKIFKLLELVDAIKLYEIIYDLLDKYNRINETTIKAFLDIIFKYSLHHDKVNEPFIEKILNRIETDSLYTDEITFSLFKHGYYSKSLDLDTINNIITCLYNDKRDSFVKPKEIDNFHKIEFEARLTPNKRIEAKNVIILLDEIQDMNNYLNSQSTDMIKIIADSLYSISFKMYDRYYHQNVVIFLKYFINNFDNEIKCLLLYNADSLPHSYLYLLLDLLLYHEDDFFINNIVDVLIEQEKNTESVTKFLKFLNINNVLIDIIKKDTKYLLKMRKFLNKVVNQDISYTPEIIKTRLLSFDDIERVLSNTKDLSIFKALTLSEFYLSNQDIKNKLRDVYPEDYIEAVRIKIEEDDVNVLVERGYDYKLLNEFSYHLLNTDRVCDKTYVNTLYKKEYFCYTLSTFLNVMEAKLGYEKTLLNVSFNYPIIMKAQKKINEDGQEFKILPEKFSNSLIIKKLDMLISLSDNQDDDFEKDIIF